MEERIDTYNFSQNLIGSLSKIISDRGKVHENSLALNRSATFLLSLLNALNNENPD